MTQYKDPTSQAGEPQSIKKWLIEWLSTAMLFTGLLLFAVWLISCQPVHG